MTSGQDMYAKKAGKLFDEGLKERGDIFGLMGKVRYKMQILVGYRHSSLLLDMFCISFIFRSTMNVKVLCVLPDHSLLFILS